MDCHRQQGMNCHWRYPCLVFNFSNISWTCFRRPCSRTLRASFCSATSRSVAGFLIPWGSRPNSSTPCRICRTAARSPPLLEPAGDSRLDLLARSDSTSCRKACCMFCKSVGTSTLTPSFFFPTSLQVGFSFSLPHHLRSHPLHSHQLHSHHIHTHQLQSNQERINMR